MSWGSPVEQERKLRIQLSIAAYAYEFHSDPIISDGEFDAACLLVQPQMETGNELLDQFFREEFDPSTGVWIHKHPELDKVEAAYQRLKGRL